MTDNYMVIRVLDRFQENKVLQIAQTMKSVLRLYTK